MNEPLAVLGKPRHVNIPGPVKAVESWWVQCPRCSAHAGTLVLTVSRTLAWWPAADWGRWDDDSPWAWRASKAWKALVRNTHPRQRLRSENQEQALMRVASRELERLRSWPVGCPLQRLPLRVQCARCPQVSRIAPEMLRAGSVGNAK